MALGKSLYDYLIVGGGSAGCVLSRRLSEAGRKVCLVEAGPFDSTWKIKMPAALMYNLCNDRYNWYYSTTQQQNMNRRIMYWPRGRVLGGSSSLNAMVYVRGHPLDYERWAEEADKSWSYRECLPYFKKSEKRVIDRGEAGPLGVSTGRCENPLFQAFIKAGQEAGYPFTEDMNGKLQEGFGKMDMTIKDGQRSNASTAYLGPAYPNMRNLDILLNKQVRKVLFKKHAPSELNIPIETILI